MTDIDRLIKFIPSHAKDHNKTLTRVITNSFKDNVHLMYQLEED